MAAYSYGNTVQTTTGDNFSVSHPSLFQSPNLDAEMLNNTANAQRTDPAALWQNAVNQQQASAMHKQTARFQYDPRDPPFTTVEKERLVAKLQSVMPNTLTNTMPTLLFYFFFSKDNIAALQKNIRYAVNKWSGFNVGDSSVLELTVAMEKVYANRAKHIDEDTAPSSILLRHIKQQLAELNNLVVNEVVPMIINGAEQHVGYLKRVETPITAKGLQRPMDTRVTGTKVYRSPADVFGM